MCVWQFHIESADYYSAMYFNCSAAFEVPYCCTSVKGGAHTCFVNLLDIHASTKHI